MSTDIIEMYIEHQEKRFNAMMAYFKDLVQLNRNALNLLDATIATDNNIHVISMNMYFRVRNLLVMSFMSIQRHENIQSYLVLRNALEATVLAGYIHACPNEFESFDQRDIVFDPKKKLSNRARAWMEEGAKPYNKDIKRAKDDINRLFAHASVRSSFGNIRHDESGEIIASQFDRVGEMEMMQALLTISYFCNSATAMYINIRDKSTQIDQQIPEFDKLRGMAMEGYRIQSVMVQKFPELMGQPVL